MSELFTEDLHQYFEKRRREVLDYVARFPCDQIKLLTEGLVASRTTDKMGLGIPDIEEQPRSKDLDRTGTIAIYKHGITNGESLKYKPSTLQFGGWPHEVTISAEELEIRLPADGNPGPKERHQGVIQQLRGNAATLAREIETGNKMLAMQIKPTIEKRQKECADIDRRRNEL